MVKKIYLIVLFVAGSRLTYSQNYIGAPTGVYAATYAGTTTIGTGGNVLVGSAGNWHLGGNIISADKGNDNAPSATGRGEAIVFSGTGTYSNAAITAGTSGNIIDGYAGVSGQAADFILPVGAGNTAYPVTAPAGAVLTAAYFSGSGSVQNATVNGTAVTEYSPYIDMDNIPAGSYMFSYPDGFSSSPYSFVLQSGNTSASGTNGSTEYSLLASTANFSASAASITVPVASALGATQVYFGTSAIALPIGMLGDLSASLENHTVLLRWRTVSERNNKGFDIQRSTDGQHYFSVGFQPSLASGGNSTEPLSYTYTDFTPTAGKVNFYRLVQTDIGGHTAVSGTVNIHLPKTAGLILYPNPAHNTVSIDGLSIGNHVNIYATDGRLVKQFTAAASRQQIDISHLPAGVYYINVMENGRVEAVQSLIIK